MPRLTSHPWACGLQRLQIAHTLPHAIPRRARRMTDWKQWTTDQFEPISSNPKAESDQEMVQFENDRKRWIRARYHVKSEHGMSYISNTWHCGEGTVQHACETWVRFYLLGRGFLDPMKSQSSGGLPRGWHHFFHQHHQDWIELRARFRFPVRNQDTITKTQQLSTVRANLRHQVDSCID